MRRSFARAYVSVLASAAPATIATLLVHEASANPPPPKVLPDPPVSAPTVDEAPTLLRKHEGLCFAFYPSGGTLAVACPEVLQGEALGQAILKNPSGRCQWIPFQSGGPGRNGYMDKCPALFATIAKANVIPESSKKLLAAANATDDDGYEPWSDPPQPARLETSPPQQVGCGVGASSDPASLAAPVAAGLALAAASRRRRRRRP